jgi:hypothetical protein
MMRREDCIDMFKRVPEDQHPYMNLVLRNSFVLSVAMVARFEETYIVFSGREGGTSDESRGFFVPYDEVSYIRIERPVRVGELKLMYGETGYLDMEDRLDAQTKAADKAEAEAAAAASPITPAPVVTPTPSVVGGSDPASIARQNLLDRIRAARANVAGTTGRLGGSRG